MADENAATKEVGIEERVKGLEKDLSEVRADLKRSERRAHDLSVERDGLRVALDTAADEAKDQRKRMDGVARQREHFRTRAEAAERKLSGTSVEKLRELTEERDRLKKDLGARDKEVAKLQAELAQKAKDLDAERHARTADRLTASNRAAALESTAETMQAARSEAYRQRDEAIRAASASETKLSKVQAELDSARAHMAALKKAHETEQAAKAPAPAV